MHAFKTLSLTFLLLVANVQAGRITYTCLDNTGGVNKKGKIETKNGGRVPDDQMQVIIDNIPTWSGGEYSTVENASSKILIVKCVNGVANRNLATTAINEQQQLVNKNIKKTKRDDGDDLNDLDVGWNVVDSDEDDEDEVEYVY